MQRSSKFAALALCVMCLTIALIFTSQTTRAAQTLVPPALKVLSPQQGATIKGSDVFVEVGVENFEIVPAPVPVGQGKDRPELNKPSQGHIHLNLDLEPLVLLDTGATSYTFQNVLPGDHELLVSLRNNNHTFLQPNTETLIRFRVVGQDVTVTDTVAPRLPETGTSTGWVVLMPLMGFAFVVIGVGVLVRLYGRRLH